MLGELLAAEAGAIVDRSPEDLREVGNYVVALEHGISRLKKLPRCVRLTQELHEKLTMGVQGHQAAPGCLRRIQNWIGKPGSTIANASYIPPPPGEVEPRLAAWEKFVHESTAAARDHCVGSLSVRSDSHPSLENSLVRVACGL